MIVYTLKGGAIGKYAAVISTQNLHRAGKVDAIKRSTALKGLTFNSLHRIGDNDTFNGSTTHKGLTSNGRH